MFLLVRDAQFGRADGKMRNSPRATGLTRWGHGKQDDFARRQRCRCRFCVGCHWRPTPPRLCRLRNLRRERCSRRQCCIGARGLRFFLTSGNCGDELVRLGNSLKSLSVIPSVTERGESTVEQGLMVSIFFSLSSVLAQTSRDSSPPSAPRKDRVDQRRSARWFAAVDSA
jgi:hypothetical protein